MEVPRRVLGVSPSAAGCSPCLTLFRGAFSESWRPSLRIAGRFRSKGRKGAGDKKKAACTKSVALRKALGVEKIPPVVPAQEINSIEAA